ncbi:MAG: right-handed parallel beta-helix repeat-containing protein [Sedimentisphaerales bacterium]|nr:right-handed parallel beta-helix repeat-containing protein [Sedimentisphaerales bacterium]
MRRAAALIIVLTACALSVEARIIYVDDNAPPGGEGSSWATAYAYLQDALADADTAEKSVEIRVAQGVYTADRGANQVPGDRTATFQLVDGVSLRGGYAGGSEGIGDLRDVGLYETILSGDLANDDVEIREPFELPDATLGNSHTVVTGTGTDHTAVLDGFTIKGGHWPLSVTHGAGPTPGTGGGMNNCPGSPTVIDCTFTHNVTYGAGGGMYCQDSRPNVVDCRFIKNYAFEGGGAMANLDGSESQVTSCTFSDNGAGADDGGAVYNRGSRVTIHGTTFRRNRADTQRRGGAVANHTSTCVLADCAFEQNASASGGAIFNDQDSCSSLQSCMFVRNSADSVGGAILDYGSDCVLENCVFFGNCARGGGAMEVSRASFINCVFAGNAATGGDSASPESPWGAGGAVLSADPYGTVTFMNCTFANNRGSIGASIFRAEARARIDNCVFWGPGVQIHDQPLENLMSVGFSAIQGGWPGEGNIDADPCFVDPGYWDANETPDDPNDDFFVEGDYHLKSQAGRWDPASASWVIDDVTSPCIDAGDPNSPIGYEPFPNGGVINMGAYGGTGEASKSYFGEPVCRTPVAGDINGDCRVDFKDLGILLNHWLQSGAKGEE